jgi:hypothetical protein
VLALNVKWQSPDLDQSSPPLFEKVRYLIPQSPAGIPKFSGEPKPLKILPCPKLTSAPTSKGGTTDTGNAAWLFFSPEVVPVLKSLLPDECKEQVLQLNHKLSVILRVMTSTHKVDMVRLDELCTKTYVFLTEFPWVHVSNSLHEILAHSHQLIALNDGFGLGQLIEQGSEGKTES